MPHPETDAARTVESLFTRLDAEGQRIALTLFRLLGAGAPVTAAALARAVGCSRPACEGWLRRVDGLQQDARQGIVGFRGLSLAETPHRLETGTATLFGWCAWDTLFLPRLVGCAANVRSRCPETGTEVLLHVTSEGVPSAPEGLRMSFVDPADAALRADIRGSFCSRIHAFPDMDAGRRWMAQHPGTTLLTLQEAEALARYHNRFHYGHALADAPGRSRADDGKASRGD